MQRASSRCLSIIELLEMIMGYLYDGGRGRTSVARMTRTSKVISSVAIPVLWRRITGVKPIMSTIAGYEWRRDPRNSSGIVWRRTVRKSLLRVHDQ